MPEDLEEKACHVYNTLTTVLVKDACKPKKMIYLLLVIICYTLWGYTQALKRIA